MSNTEHEVKVRTLDNVYHVGNPIYTHMAVKYDLHCELYGIRPTDQQRDRHILQMIEQYKQTELLILNAN